MSLQPFFFRKNKNAFTLIEMLIVFSISSFITVSLLSSVLRSRVSIAELTRIVIADIRLAQANALNSKQYNGTHRCGYGVSPSDSSSYFIYASQPTKPNNPDGCSGNWKYNPAQDTPIVLTRVLDSRLEIFDPNGVTPPNFEDITFEPFNARIRIDNQHVPTNQAQNLSQIVLRKKGATCPSQNCVYICIYSFGRISARTTECAICDNPSTCPW